MGLRSPRGGSLAAPLPPHRPLRSHVNTYITHSAATPTSTRPLTNLPKIRPKKGGVKTRANVAGRETLRVIYRYVFVAVLRRDRQRRV